ncbi:MAG: hypothetical protein KY468_01045 [Armatimonadetes bacterium]|nr:hypothetical protein [Armatimonadota bacterium]
MACLLLGIGWQAYTVASTPAVKKTALQPVPSPDRAEILRIQRETERLNRELQAMEGKLSREIRTAEIRERRREEQDTLAVLPPPVEEMPAYEMPVEPGWGSPAPEASRFGVESGSYGAPDAAPAVHRERPSLASLPPTPAPEPANRIVVDPQPASITDPNAELIIPPMPEDTGVPPSAGAPVEPTNEAPPPENEQEMSGPDPRQPARVVAAWTRPDLPDPKNSRLEVHVWNANGDKIEGTPVRLLMTAGSGIADAITRLTNSEGVAVFRILWSGKGARRATAVAGVVSIDTPEAPPFSNP